VTRRRKAAAATVLDIAQGRVPKKDPGAQLAGALARKSGIALEAALALINDWYDKHGVAAIEKVNPPVHGWGDSLHVGASTVDYTGTIKVMPPRYEDAALRRGIAFDAKKVTGAASFGLDHVGAGKNYAKNRMRLAAQINYLRGLRDRHGYVVGFLLYCDDLETAWWIGAEHLDALARGESVAIRTKPRATKADPTPAVVHHHPHIAAPLDRAAIPQIGTRRPLLDYLSLTVPR
jgi:hypothetical protein